jgi:hypothetical protein
MSGDYKYLVVDAATGENIAEIPLADVTFSYVLNGCGQLTATFPADAYFSTVDLFGGELLIREITVLRDEVAVWNGPIVNLAGSRRGGWELTAREASWYLQKRTIEEDLTYTSEDIFQIARDLIDYATGKVSDGADGTLPAGSNIFAALPRFTVTSGSAGTSKSYTFSGTAGHLVSEALDDALVADPTTGLDYAMGYRTGSTRQSCVRTLLLGSPALGVQQEVQLRASDLYDFGRTLDYEQSATRITILGGGGYVKRLQSTEAVGASAILLENVTDRQNISDPDAIDNFARDDRRARHPPVHDRWVEVIPSVTIPFDLYSVGDLVAFDVDGPNGQNDLLSLSANSRRLVQIDVTPRAGGDPERMRLTVSTLVSDLAE